mmetsp:Transcript_4230/g.15836  ORF Transcript_4230/g.15836 Transcript_4230/m.15836 type:complete len:273 (-) Transcript_4230:2772-3590(-)
MARGHGTSASAPAQQRRHRRQLPRESRSLPRRHASRASAHRRSDPWRNGVPRGSGLHHRQRLHGTSPTRVSRSTRATSALASPCRPRRLPRSAPAPPPLPTATPSTSALAPARVPRGWWRRRRGPSVETRRQLCQLRSRCRRARAPAAAAQRLQPGQPQRWRWRRAARRCSERGSLGSLTYSCSSRRRHPPHRTLRRSGRSMQACLLERWPQLGLLHRAWAAGRPPPGPCRRTRARARSVERWRPGLRRTLRQEQPRARCCRMVLQGQCARC